MMHYIGVDLHKTNFVACFLEIEGRSCVKTFPLTEQGLSAFEQHLTRADEVAVEMSANAYYFHDRIVKSVRRVVLVDAYRFAVVSRSKKKTDRHDAKALAQFLKLGWLPEVSLPSQQIRQLRQLFQARESLIEMTTKLKNMGHAALTRNGLALSRSAFKGPRSRAQLMRQSTSLSAADQQILELTLRQIEALGAEIKGLESEIIRLGKDLPGVSQLLQIRGLGMLTAIGLLAEIGDINWFAGSKQLVAYAGLATAVRQSNEVDRHGRITKQGRKKLRGILIQAVLTLARGNKTPLQEFYFKKKAEKGAGKAICATARKLLTVIFVMLKRGLDYWYLEERLYNQKLNALKAAA
jgi:transposase